MWNTLYSKDIDAFKELSLRTAEPTTGVKMLSSHFTSGEVEAETFISLLELGFDPCH